jgi:carboxymethylenebutenolidase
MIEREFRINMHHGISDAVFFAPESTHKLSGILFLTDIRGPREAHSERCRRIAALGYTVLMPNVFYRTRKPPMFDFKMDWSDQRTQQRFAELTQPLTPDAIIEDGHDYIRTLLAQPETQTGAIGMAAHCFTGQMGLRIAAAFPEAVRAMASFHGGGLYKDGPASPHQVVAHRQGEKMGQLLFEHAENDSSMPAEAIARFDAELLTSGAKYSSKIIHGAGHGWTVSDHATYNQKLADQSFEDMKTLFAAALPTA